MSKLQPGRKGGFLSLPRHLSLHCGDRQWLDCAALQHRQGRRSVVAAVPGPLAEDYRRFGLHHCVLPQGEGRFARWRRARGIAALRVARRLSTVSATL